MQHLLSLARDHFPSRYGLLYLVAFTGMRISEVRGLDWRSVNLGRRIVRVEQRADEWGTIGEVKTGRDGVRHVELGPDLARVVQCMHADAGDPGSGLVFSNRAGKPIQVQNLYRRFLYPLQIDANVHDGRRRPKYGFHSFRHWYASGLIHLGYSVAQVQYRLGHSDPSLTLRTYVHLWQERDRVRNAGHDLETMVFG